MPEPLYTTEITLRDGRKATLRPLAPADVEPLTALFLSLSQETRRRYGPHPFDSATAERLCATIDHDVTIRFVAVLGDGDPAPQFIGYMILTRDISESDLERLGSLVRPTDRASFAPVVADAHQEQGIGTQMAQHVIRCAGQAGLKQVLLMGGVIADNERAKRLYTHLGFRRVGEFWTQREQPILNYDMILDL